MPPGTDTTTKGEVAVIYPLSDSSRFLCYRWVEKQENGFKKWLNFVLTPPDGFEIDVDAAKGKAGKLDVAKLWSACSKVLAENDQFF